MDTDIVDKVINAENTDNPVLPADTVNVIRATNEESGIIVRSLNHIILTAGSNALLFVIVLLITR